MAAWTQFFWFNTGYFVVMISSVVCYDFFGGAWLILPLAWAIERASNGFCHVWWAIRYREYSPGLVSSILMWMNLYFVLRYRPALPPLTTRVVLPALFIALVWTAFLFFYIPVVKGRAKQRNIPLKS